MPWFQPGPSPESLTAACTFLTRIIGNFRRLLELLQGWSNNQFFWNTSEDGFSFSASSLCSCGTSSHPIRYERALAARGQISAYSLVHFAFQTHFQFTHLGYQRCVVPVSVQCPWFSLLALQRSLNTFLDVWLERKARQELWTKAKDFNT